MTGRSLLKFCKAKITTYFDIIKLKQHDLQLDQIRGSVLNLQYINSDQNEQLENNNENNNIIFRGRRLEFSWETIAPENRELMLELFERQRIYYPDRKIKMGNRFFKFNDRPKPNPPFTKVVLNKKTLAQLKDICKRYDICHSGKDKAELTSAIMRFQRKGEIGKKEMCYDGMPISLLEPLDGNGYSIDDYDFNSEDNSNLSTN